MQSHIIMSLCYAKRVWRLWRRGDFMLTGHVAVCYGDPDQILLRVQ